MLQQVILQSSTPMTLEIGNANPDEILILKSISGLTPADLTLFTGDYAGPGGYYQGRRASKRNPVFNFKLNENYEEDIVISDVRELLYRTFYEPQALTDGLQVTLIDDRKPDRYFICYAEKWDGEIFEQKPSAGVSTLCVDPYLRSVLETEEVNAGGWVSTPLDYEGSTDTGIEVIIKVTSITNQVVFSIDGELMTLSKPSNFAVNDLITINTEEGSRAIKLNGSDVMALLTADSEWIQLTAQDTTLSTYGTVVGDGKSVITSYKYRAAWWGA